jgi:hypothetical protein
MTMDEIRHDLRSLSRILFRRPIQLALWSMFISSQAWPGAVLGQGDPPEPPSRSISVVPEEARIEKGFKASESVGVFVGVRHFEDKKFAEVPYAVDDAVDLAYLFSIELELVHPRHVVLAIKGIPQKPESQDRLETLRSSGAAIKTPTLSGIYEILETHFPTSGTEGLLILSVASHGFSAQGEDYLVASDSRRNHISSTGIKVAEVLDDVARAKSPRRIVLLDACRERLSSETRAGGADKESKMGEAFAKAIANAEGQVILSGTTLGGYSYDDHKKQNGVFSAAVKSGLLGRAEPNEEGFITASSLVSYTNNQVIEWVKQNRSGETGNVRGIESRLGGEAAGMPLAVDPEYVYKRNEHFLEVLKFHMDGRNITGRMYDEIARALRDADRKKLKPLVARLKKLEAYGSPYAVDIAYWWKEEGRKGTLQKGARASEQQGERKDPAESPAEDLDGVQTETNDDLSIRGLLVIEILPSADVYLDGTLYEQDAQGLISIPVSPNKPHMLQLRSVLGVKYYRNLTVGVDGNRDLGRFDFSQTGLVRIGVENARAGRMVRLDIDIDGRRRVECTKAPCELELNMGQHSVRASAEGIAIQKADVFNGDNLIKTVQGTAETGQGLEVRFDVTGERTSVVFLVEPGD